MSLMIDILPLNTIEIMTMVNFKHLDEEKLLENGKVLKQKSGYTHSFTDELYEIFKEFDITPMDNLIDIYGEHYIKVFEYNKWLTTDVHGSKKITDKEIEAFNLIAPYLYKYYFTLKGYEKNFYTIRNGLMEKWDTERLSKEIKNSLLNFEKELSFEEVIEKKGIYKFMENRGFTKIEKKKFRYEIYDRIEFSLSYFEKEFQYFLEIDDKIRKFANKNSKIIATLIQRFQELGVDFRNEDTPNYDFYNFYLRYVGNLEVKINDEKN